MKLELAHHLHKAGATVAEVERILDLHKYPDNPRTVLLTGLLSAIVQHHRSILLLIKSGIDGSAHALARDIIRATRYGLWISCCATSDQVLGIDEEDVSVPGISEMSKEIRAAYAGDPFFTEMIDRWAAKIYRYTHKTIVRVGQFRIDPKSGLRREDEDVGDMVTTTTLCLVVLAAKFLATQKLEDESKQVELLATAYAKES